MNVYYLGVTNDGKAVCLESTINVHGGANADRAMALLNGGKTLGEVDEMICGSCGNFFDEGKTECNCMD